MAVPDGCYWGVDSLIPIHQPMGGKKTLFEFVQEKTKATPSFWGRYIGQHNGKNALPKEEVAFIRQVSPHTRLLVVYNNVRPGGGYDTGRIDAQAAISFANALDISSGVVIYANVEPSDGKVSADWIRGWWDIMYDSKYGGRGGIYGNTSGITWLAYLRSAYAGALEKMKSPPSMGWYPPLWAQRPFKGCMIPEQINFSYQPDQIWEGYGAAVVWQYAINCYIPSGQKNGLIDMDLATQIGYDGMWHVGPEMSQLTDDERRSLMGPPA